VKAVALIPCFECQKEISDRAVSCPQCGAPISIEKENRNNFVLFFGRLFGQIQAYCRKCRSPIKAVGQNFCETCGTYFPFHESNKMIYTIGVIVFCIWFFTKFLFPKTFSFLY
jgi:predicted amidophosphoribosyltransferase